MTHLFSASAPHGWSAQADERERARLAHALHEQVQQHLAAAQMDLQLACAAAGTSAQALAHLSSAMASVRSAMTNTSHAVQALRPRTLDLLGLHAAMEELVQACRAQGPLQIELECLGDEAALTQLAQAVTDCAFRVARECLGNVLAHADAQFVHVVMDATDPQAFELQIQDDGIGLQPEDLDKPGVLGLKAMVERVASMGGTLHLTRGLGPRHPAGTRVTARWPTRTP